MTKLSLVLIFLTVILVGCLFGRRDAFTSPGTMVQLATSHVPTQEDVEYYRKVYPQLVRHDITDMTGEDPGPIAVPMPQLWF